MSSSRDRRGMRVSMQRPSSQIDSTSRAAAPNARQPSVAQPTSSQAPARQRIITSQQPRRVFLSKGQGGSRFHWQGREWSRDELALALRRYNIVVVTDPYAPVDDVLIPDGEIYDNTYVNPAAPVHRFSDFLTLMGLGMLFGYGIRHDDRYRRRRRRRLFSFGGGSSDKNKKMPNDDHGELKQQHERKKGGAFDTVRIVNQSPNPLFVAFASIHPENSGKLLHDTPDLIPAPGGLRLVQSQAYADLQRPSFVLGAHRMLFVMEVDVDRQMNSYQLAIPSSLQLFKLGNKTGTWSLTTSPSRNRLQQSFLVLKHISDRAAGGVGDAESLSSSSSTNNSSSTSAAAAAAASAPILKPHRRSGM